MSRCDILNYSYRYDTSFQVFFPVKTGLNVMSDKNRFLLAETQPCFIEFIDVLFDVLNSPSMSNAKCLRRALSANSGHLKFITEAKTALKA